MEQKTTKTPQNGSWIYEYDNRYPAKYELTDVRYILGEVWKPKAEALICIGVNPSTAMPEDLDPTLTRVKSFATQNGYGSWYMLNLYPQRATDPENMDLQPNQVIIEENLRHIGELLKQVESADIWCAWGQLITKRDYLQCSLNAILKVIGDRELKAYDTTKKGYPKHPLTMPKNARLKSVKIENNGTITKK